MVPIDLTFGYFEPKINSNRRQVFFSLFDLLHSSDDRLKKKFKFGDQKHMEIS